MNGYVLTVFMLLVIGLFFTALSISMLVACMVSYTKLQEYNCDQIYKDLVKKTLIFALVAFVFPPMSVVSFYYFYRSCNVGVLNRSWTWYLVVPIIVTIMFVCALWYVFDNLVLMPVPYEYQDPIMIVARILAGMTMIA